MTNTLNKIIHNGDEYEFPSGWWDVLVSDQAGNIFTSWMKIWWGTKSDFDDLVEDSNTAYLLLADQPTPTPRQPWANTLAYWKFDDNLSDSSGNNNDATYYYWTAITYSTWLVWDSAVFWPTILTTPLNTTLFNSEFTVSFCVYITAIHSSNVIRMRWWQLWYTAIQYEWWEGWLQRYDQNMGRTGWSWTPTLNTWHHIVITGDGVNPLVCYINGNVVSAHNYNYSYNNSSKTLWLGNNESVSDALWLQWRFDEFIIEDKARTASDVANYRTYNLWL